MPVYLIRCGQAGPVKIGFSEDWQKRLYELQVANYEELTVLRLFEGGVFEEEALHLRFAQLRIRGEWFSFSREMLGNLGLREIPFSPERERALCTIADQAYLRPVDHSQAHLLSMIESFLENRLMAETTFGKHAVNDGKFMKRLRSGENMTTATLKRVHEYLRDNQNEAAA